MRLPWLDDLEKKVMCYLAINPTPVSFEKFRNSVQIDSASELINVLKSLDRRSIIEVEKIKQRNQIIFRLQPLIRMVLREYYDLQSP